MAIVNEEQFRKRISGNIQGGLYCIFGEDGFLKDYYRNKLTACAVNPAMAAFNLHTFVRDENSLTDIADAVEALPVMSERQCVMVRDYPLPSIRSDDFELLESIVSNVPENTVLVFFFAADDIEYPSKKPNAWTKYFDLFSKYGIVAKIDRRTPAAVAKTLVNGAKERNTSISQENALYLVDRAGTDLQTLLNEFNKVCAYADGQPVSKEMIDTCVTECFEASVFDISHAVIEGDADEAFRILRGLLRQKTDSVSVVGALSFTWTELYRAKLMQTENKTLSDFSESYGYTRNSYGIKKVIPDAKRCSMEQIRQSLSVLSEADAASKSKSISDVIILEEMLAKLADIFSKRRTVC